MATVTLQKTRVSDSSVISPLSCGAGKHAQEVWLKDVDTGEVYHEWVCVSNSAGPCATDGLVDAILSLGFAMDDTGCP